MRFPSLPIGVFAVLCGLFAGATMAQAGNETWVAGNGTDSGGCLQSAPCRTFAFAHGKTNNGGTINVLTAGNFGPLTITKKISIVADGVEAVINTASLAAGVRIMASGGQTVTLRGLTIEGVANNHGISFTSGAGLIVHNCVIRGGVNGINFSPSAGTTELHVSDSVITGAVQHGIEVVPFGAANVRATVSRVRTVDNKTNGMFFNGANHSGSIRATVNDSVSSGNGFAGVRTDANTGTTNVMIDRTTLANNVEGVSSNGPNATVRIGDSTVSGNATSLGFGSSFGGHILSFGTNKVDDSSTPTGSVSYK